MISRAAGRLARPVSGRVAGTALRPSAVALGKRPMLAYTSPIVMGTRALSWTPWRSEASAPIPEPVPVDHLPASASAGAAPSAPVTGSASSLPASSSATTATPPTFDSHESLLSSLKAHETNAGPSIADSLSSLPPASITDPSLLPQSPALGSVPSLEELVLHSGKSLSEVLHSPEAVHAAIKTADLKLIGLEHGVFSLSGWVQEALVGMHSVTGLPWWASIAALTVTLRLTLLPLIIRTLKHNVRLQAVQPQMTALFKRLADAKKAGDTQAQQVVAGSLTNLMKSNDVSPFRPLLMPLIQMPFFLAFFWGLRSLAQLPLPQLKEGGFGWVMDLTLSDPYYILPITSMLFTNLVLRVGSDGTAAGQSANANMGHFKNALSIISVAAIPFIGKMPAAVLFYWTIANAFTLTQALLLRQPSIKALLRIPPAPPAPPPPPGEAVNPDPSYLDTWNALKGQISGPDSVMSRARQAQAEALAQQQAAAGPNSGKRMGGDVMYERVKEASTAAASASASGANANASAGASVHSQVRLSEAGKSWMEAAEDGEGTAAPKSTTGARPASASARGPRPSKEEAKAQRLAAARERRARQ